MRYVEMIPQDGRVLNKYATREHVNRWYAIFFFGT